MEQVVGAMNNVTTKVCRLWVLTPLVSVLVITGCASGTPDEETEDVGVVVVEEDQAPGQTLDDEQAEEPDPPRGELTESGFPNSEAPGVIAMFSDIAPSVLKVGDEFSYGTGWVIDSNHVVTNWHVVDFMADPVTMETYGGELIYGSVIATEEFDDIAVIRLDQPTSLTPLPLSTSPAGVGDPVFFIGHPGSIGDWITGVGVVTDFDEFFPAFVRSTLPADPGASGSAMLNLQGEVVALISGCMGELDENRPLGDGTTLYSSTPPPPVSDNCGGTDIATVKAFVDQAVASQN